MKQLLTLTFFFLISFSYAQTPDTLFFDLDANKVGSLKDASYFETRTNDPNDETKVQHKTFFISGKPKSEWVTSKGNIVGKKTEWFENGQLRLESNYNKKGQCHGSFVVYWENGKIKRNDIFNNGKLVEGKCFNNKGVEVKYYEYEKLPQFPGGPRKYTEFFNREFKMLTDYSGEPIVGEVKVSFFVEKDGSITDLNIDEGTERRLNAAALKFFLKMPKFEPYIFEGDTLRKKVVYKVKFTVEETTEHTVLTSH